MNIKEHRAAGRWVVIPAAASFIDEASKVITLDKYNIEIALKQLVDWVDEPGKNRHGKFFVDAVSFPKKDRELLKALGDKFVLVK